MIKDVTITSKGDFQSITFSREEDSSTVDMSFHYPKGCGYASFSLEDMKTALGILSREDNEDGKWTVAVEQADFSEKIWQCKTELSEEDFNLCLEQWADMVQDILLCLADEKPTEEILEKIDNDHYRLGDLVNFLSNLRIAVK